MEIKLLLILFLPLISFVFQIFFGRYIKKIAHWVSVFLLAVCLVISIDLLTNIFNGFFHNNVSLYDISISWLTTNNISIYLGAYVDSLTVIMLFVVSLISFLVHLYSIEYMFGDKRYLRYFAYLGLFTFSMNGIVLSNNLFMTYIFWELVGFSSYLLIGFWYEKDSASEASKKAFLFNRVGDIGMFIGIMLIFFSFHTFNYNEIGYAVSQEGASQILTIAGILVFMGAVGKSAQVPLHVWLPDAMEGPTPVSALIHAATMVAAGVYMTLRIFPFLTIDALHFIAIIGSITAFIASIIAITQNDIKRVLAYSTVSQLGYMIAAIGFGSYVFAFFHLITHAMFKACLFLCSGSVIHSMHHSLDEIDDHSTDPQDMNNMGALRHKLPITYTTMLISTLSLCGIPFFSGFLSKDSILASSLAYSSMYGGFTYMMPFLVFGAAFCTAFYMFRLIFKTFHGSAANKKINDHISESGWMMTFPIMLLSFLSFAFVFTFPHLNPIHSDGWFIDSIYPAQSFTGFDSHMLEEEIHHNHSSAMWLSILFALCGIALSWLFYYKRSKISDTATNIFSRLKLFELSYNKFYFDELYNAYIITPFMNFSKRASFLDWDIYDQIFIDMWGWITLKLSHISAYLDYDILDQFFIDGFGKKTDEFGKELKNTQGGVLQNYLIGGLFGLLIILIIIQQG